LIEGEFTSLGGRKTQKKALQQMNVKGGCAKKGRKKIQYKE
jgi:hypothetical protein